MCVCVCVCVYEDLYIYTRTYTIMIKFNPKSGLHVKRLYGMLCTILHSIP